MRLIPRIIICDELPQWIISSDIAAYHPYSQTIYIAKFARYNLKIWIHELGHHLIHVCGGRRDAQMKYERWCK